MTPSLVVPHPLLSGPELCMGLGITGQRAWALFYLCAAPFSPLRSGSAGCWGQAHAIYSWFTVLPLGTALANWRSPTRSSQCRSCELKAPRR